MGGRGIGTASVIGAVLAAAVLGGAGPVPAQTERERRRTPVVEAVERAAPAVVNISATETAAGHGRFGDPVFDEFFNRYFERGARGETPRRNLGSGFIFRKDGYVVTNHHVVSRAVRIWVSTREGKEYEARVVGSDPAFDLAVLKVEPGGDLREVPLGDSDDLMAGETVIAIGNPFGLSDTVTTGVVSAVRRSIRVDENMVYHDFIQTDASINPGNSGGPLVNLLGQVIGINTAIYRGGEGIGFAIPVNVARKVIDSLIRYGKVRRGWLGLFVQDLTPRLRESFAYREEGGVVVTRVQPAPGGAAHIQPGDIVISLNGREVDSVARFAELSAAALPEDEVNVAFVRKGDRRTAVLTSRLILPEEAARFLWDILGIELDLSRKGKGGMILSRIRKGSPAERAGLERGDVVVELNEAALEGDEEFLRAASGLPFQGRVPLLVRRGNTVYSLTLSTNI
jgi:serine protease Do